MFKASKNRDFKRESFVRQFNPDEFTVPHPLEQVSPPVSIFETFRKYLRRDGPPVGNLILSINKVRSQMDGDWNVSNAIVNFDTYAMEQLKLKERLQTDVKEMRQERKQQPQQQPQQHLHIGELLINHPGEKSMSNTERTRWISQEGSLGLPKSSTISEGVHPRPGYTSYTPQRYRLGSVTTVNDEDDSHEQMMNKRLSYDSFVAASHRVRPAATKKGTFSSNGNSSANGKERNPSDDVYTKYKEGQWNSLESAGKARNSPLGDYRSSINDSECITDIPLDIIGSSEDDEGSFTYNWDETQRKKHTVPPGGRIRTSEYVGSIPKALIVSNSRVEEEDEFFTPKAE